MNTSTVRNFKAFTLIELLVVIAIIALLLTMLAPSLTKAKELAAQAVCMANQKNCGVALLFYADDYNGTVLISWYAPGFGYSTSHSYTWARAIGGWAGGEDHKYLDDFNVMLCPNEAPQVWDTTDTARFSFVYGGTHYYSGELNNTGMEGVSVPIVGKHVGSGCLINLEQVKQAGDVPMLIDSYSSTYQSQMYLVYATPQIGTREVAAHLRHANRANALFADGHAEPCNEDRLSAVHIKGGFDDKYVLNVWP